MTKESGPFDGRYGTACVTETSLVQATEQSPTELVALTRVDTPAYQLELTFSAVLIFTDMIDFARLKNAVQKWAQLNSLFAGRIIAEGRQPQVHCNNAGIPLTLVHWPEGRTSDFPHAVGFSSWECTSPAHFTPPIFIDDMDGLQVAFEGEAPLKLRLTTLSDGGCVLTATVWHALIDGSRLIAALSDLACLYKGGTPPARSATRELLTPAGLAKSLPDGEKIVQEAIATHQGTDEDREPNIREAHRRIFGEKKALTPNFKFPPEVPEGLRALSLAILHLTRKDLENVKAALLKSWDNGKPAPKLSNNDIVVAIVWCMRRLESGLTLPGLDASSVKDLGLITVDLGYNVLPSSLLDGFVGNAYVCMPLMLPPIEKPAAATSSEAENLNPTGDAEDWMHAVGHVAASARAALENFRAGGGLQTLLGELIIPNKLQSDFGFLAALQYNPNPEALRLGGLVTSWERFKTEEVDFGSGPPLMVLPYFHDLVERPVYVVSSPGHDGIYLHLAMPAAAVSRISGLEQIMPNSRFL